MSPVDPNRLARTPLSRSYGYCGRGRTSDATELSLRTTLRMAAPEEICQGLVVDGFWAARALADGFYISVPVGR